MPENTPTSGAIPQSSRLPSRLRTIAAVLMAIGIVSAELILWCGTHSSGEMSDDPSLLQNEKGTARQSRMLYGNQAVVVQQLADQLKRPVVQAGIVIVVSGLLGGGCFYLARLIENDPARQTR